MIKIQILGHEYEVCLDEDTILEQDVDYGLIDFDNCTIFIDPRLKKTFKQETLLHEIIEALNYHLALKLKHDSQIVPLSESLYKVLSENKLHMFGKIIKPTSKTTSK